MATATAKAWISTNRRLLAHDGDASATVLFARKGQALRMEQVTQFENAHDFFSGIEKPATKESPKGDKLDAMTIPQLKELCDAEGIEYDGFKLKADYLAALRAAPGGE